VKEQEMAHRHVLMMLDASANAFLNDRLPGADTRATDKTKRQSAPAPRVDAALEKELARLEKELSLALADREVALLH
jgi:hypothetical protein